MDNFEIVLTLSIKHSIERLFGDGKEMLQNYQETKENIWTDFSCSKSSDGHNPNNLGTTDENIVLSLQLLHILLWK